MIMHHALEPDCSFLPDDLVKLKEGIFVLNKDLNPMELARIGRTHTIRDISTKAYFEPLNKKNVIKDFLLTSN